jgi:hypothetical protein
VKHALPLPLPPSPRHVSSRRKRASLPAVAKPFLHLNAALNAR